LTISPSNRSASAMPSALLPVAVGPTMATSLGLTPPRAARRRRWPARAPPLRDRSAASASALVQAAPARRGLVVVEDDRHHHPVVRIGLGQRHRRVRRLD